MFTAAMRPVLEVYLFLCREREETAAPVLLRIGKEAFCFPREISVSADQSVQATFGHLDQWTDLLTSNFPSSFPKKIKSLPYNRHGEE